MATLSVDRLMSRIHKESNGCWIVASPNKSVRVNGKMISIVRYLSFLRGVSLPHKAEIWRSCGNMRCVSPSHLVFPSVNDRFWAKVDKDSSPGGCWNWTASVDGGGYGVFVVTASYREKAHRYSYKLVHKDIPIGMDVLHTCDNPSCVNPDHLFCGTNLDNVHDKVSKNRQSRLYGEANGRAELTEDQVRSMRALYASGGISLRSLASRYDVSMTQTSRIIHFESWKWVK